jgi:putative peptidoglycan lipid II flippase
MARPPDQAVFPSPDPLPVAGVAKAAGIISLGNVASRTLGLAREFVKADLFGATGLVSAFEVANIVPTIIYDLLVGGMISSALVPVLSDYAVSEERRAEFWRLVSTLLSLAGLFLALFVVLAEVLAPQIAWLFGAREFEDPTLWAVTTRLLRIMLPAVLFLNLSGLLTGTLYSLRRFTFPAFTAATYNLMIVVVALLRPDRITSLAWGVLVGAVVQVALQLPELDLAQLRWHWNLRHPALGRIIRLYLPIVLGVIVSQIAIAISYNLATRTGDEGVATMRYATTLIQFPLGLVATAVSVAILPTLSRQANDSLDASPPPAFGDTLAQGLKLVLVLIIPATVGLFLLAHPIVALAFEHGDFLPSDTAVTATVLRLYLIGLPFAAADQLLIFAFYARKNTLAPALVGVLSVVVYLIVAVALLKPMGLYSLMVADSVKHMTHAAVMTFLLQRQGGIRDGITLTTGKAIAASLVMGLAVWGVTQTLSWSGGTFGRLLLVGAGGATGLFTYGLVISWLRVTEVQLLWGLLRSKARPGP